MVFVGVSGALGSACAESDVAGEDDVPINDLKAALIALRFLFLGASLSVLSSSDDVPSSLTWMEACRSVFEAVDGVLGLSTRSDGSGGGLCCFVLLVFFGDVFFDSASEVSLSLPVEISFRVSRMGLAPALEVIVWRNDGSSSPPIRGAAIRAGDCCVEVIRPRSFVVGLGC